MSKEELGRPALIRGALDGKYTAGEVARRLGPGEWRVQQLKQAVRLSGDGAVIRENAGRHPANYTDEELRRGIITLKQNGLCQETNFTRFRNSLENGKVSR